MIDYQSVRVQRQKQMNKHHSSDCQQLFKILMIN